MKNRHRLLWTTIATLMVVTSASTRAQANIVTWTNATGDNQWSNVANWAPHGPGPDDDVFIGPSGVVVSGGASSFRSLSAPDLTIVTGGGLTVELPWSIQTLTITGGGVTNTGGLTVTGTLAMSGGTIGGPGTLTIPASASFQVSGSIALASVIEHMGTTDVDDGGEVVVASGGVFNNRPGATFNVNGDGTLNQNSFSSSTFNNEGSLIKTAGSGALTVIVKDFKNLPGGLLQIQSGSVDVGANVASFEGTIDFAPNTSMDIRTTVTWAGPTVIGDQGVIRLQTFGGLTITQPSSMFNLELVGGGLALNTELAVTQLLQWTSGGGVGGVGPLRIPPGSELQMDASNQMILSATLENEGLAVLPDGGTLLIGSGGVFNNRATFNVNGDATLTQNSFSSSTFNNYGNLTKTSGTGELLVFVKDFRNQPGGVFRIDSGIVNMGSNVATFEGTVEFGPNTSMDIRNATNWAGASVVGNQGVIRLQTFGGLTVTQPSSFFNLELVGGGMTLDAELAMTELLQWTSGPGVGGRWAAPNHAGQRAAVGRRHTDHNVDDGGERGSDGAGQRGRPAHHLGRHLQQPSERDFQCVRRSHFPVRGRRIDVQQLRTVHKDRARDADDMDGQLQQPSRRTVRDNGWECGFHCPRDAIDGRNGRFRTEHFAEHSGRGILEGCDRGR